MENIDLFPQLSVLYHSEKYTIARVCEVQLRCPLSTQIFEQTK